MRGLRRRPLALLLFLAAGCTTGGAERDPIARTLTWYSYLNGDDLRAACAAGATDRYRLVYNAIWTEQVRTYEVVAERALPGTQGDGKAPAAELTARAFTPAPIFNVYLDAISGRQPVVESRVRMTPEAFLRFRRHVSESGFYKPPPVGIWLRSDRFYWLAAGCTDGEFHFNAWPVTDADFGDLHFVSDLFFHDQTGREVAKPRVMPRESFNQTGGVHRKPKIAFRVQVGENGLAGH